MEYSSCPITRSQNDQTTCYSPSVNTLWEILYHHNIIYYILYHHNGTHMVSCKYDLSGLGEGGQKGVKMLTFII